MYWLVRDKNATVQINGLFSKNISNSVSVIPNVRPRPWLRSKDRVIYNGPSLGALEVGNDVPPLAAKRNVMI